MASRPQPRILCLDGGGIRGLAEIRILKELMLQVRLQNSLDFTPEPAQCFDYICGTSTGGLVAVLIGRLGKTMDECEALFRDLGAKIFSGGSSWRTARLVLKGSQHNREGLADVIRSQAGQETLHEADASAGGHVPVAVVSVSKTTGDEYLFRSYGVRAASEACSVVDACLATSAATTFFPSITIDGIEYVDGAFGKNNPSGVVLRELESVESPMRLANAVAEVGCFVSVGAGRPTFDRESDSFKSKITPKGITSITDAAKICVKIATNCHREHLDVEYRFKNAGRADIYHRFDVDRGLESVELNEADENALKHIAAVTKAYLKSQQSSLEQCALMINPRPNSFSSTPPVLMLSTMPMATESFYGRDAELREMKAALDPSKPGRKSLLIYGMGGSGKTQLTLRHIRQEGNRYSAVIWINGSTKEHAQRSFSEAAGYITSSWPRDLPTPYAGSDDLLLVSARLRSTLLTNWLLVIDSADNPEQGQLSSFIPTCPHGSVLITSTRLLKLNGFKPDRPMSMNGLDPQSSQDLLVEMSGRDEDDNDDRMIAREIGKELSGMPLAVEQAGALIRDGEFSFADFLAAYKTEYTRLMENLTPSDESRVFTTILDMTYRSVEKNPQYLALLNLIGVLGPWQIPLNLLEGFSFAGTDSSDRLSDDIKALQSLLGHPNFLRAALRRLATLCVITLREEAGSVVGVMIHRVMCQWCLKKVTEAGKQDLILQAAYGLARGIRCPSSVIHALELARDDQTKERKLAAPLSYCLDLLHSRVPRDDLDLSHGRLRDAYATIVTQAAWVNLSIGSVEKSKGYFLAAVEYDTLRNNELDRQWPADETSLVMLWGLASAYHRSGDLKEAEETFGTAVELSKSLHGDEGEETRALSTRYVHVSKRKGVMSRHHQSAVVASASAKRAPFHLPGENSQDSTECDGRSAPAGPVPSSASLDERRATLLESHDADLQDLKVKLSHFNLAEQNLLWNLCTVYDSTTQTRLAITDLVKVVDVENDVLTNVEMLLLGGADIESEDTDQLYSGSATPLTHAVVTGNEPLVQFLLDKGAEIEASGTSGDTPLILAVETEHEGMVHLLIKNGVEKDAINVDGDTALMAACARQLDTLVQILLDHGANPNNRLNNGRTALMAACAEGSNAMVQMLLNHGAKPNVKANRGVTALMVACEKGSNVIVEILLNHGAKPNMKANRGVTALMVACEKGSNVIVQILLNHGAKPNMKAKRGVTALMVACAEGSDAMVQMLLDHGADPNAKTNSGNTALMDMAVIGQQTKIRTLLYGGADVNVANDDGKTALMMAARSGHAESVALLLKNDAEAEAVNNDGETALIVAVRGGDREAVGTLLRNGADIEATTKDGDTAFDLASDEMYEFMERVLLGVGVSQESSS